MADEAETTTPTTLYLSAAPTSNGNISGETLQPAQASHNLYQLQVNPNNPNEGVLLPAPGADAMLSANESVLTPAYRMAGLPKPGQDFLDVQEPTRVEKIGDNWKITEMGSVKFSAEQKPALNVYGDVSPQAQEQVALTTEAEGLANEASITTGATRTEAKADLEEIANRAEQGPDAGRAAYADELRDKAATLPGDDAERNLTTSFPLNREDAPEGAGQTPQEAYLANLTRLGATVELDNSKPELTANVSYAADHANANELAELLKTSGQYAPARDEQQTAAQQQAPAATPAAPGAPEAPGTEPVGELQIQWKQQGDEVAPLLEMRAYLDQLKDAGVAVGAMKMEKGEDGKLTGSFGVSYDPESNKLGQLEATLQGLKQVGNGLEVVEKPSQAAARRQEVGYDDDYEPQRSKQVKEAFGVKQWDALAANITAVPKTALTGPEQVQQSAAEKRVEQLAEQQGKTKEQILKDGKSIFDIDTQGNPASVFLKNFYAHLNGNPKTRQTLEVDYDKTREALQARLLKKAGSAQLDQGDEQVKQAPQGQAAAVAKPDDALSNPKLVDPKTIPVTQISAAEMEQHIKAAAQQPAKAPTLFQASDVPQKVLASLGLNTADLEQNGQLQKLLNGQKTDLLPMQVAGKDGQEAVKFEGKMVLHREADGTATLKMELPQEKLVIPNEIGGQPFTPEQRQKLETEGNAGLIRGLKDEQGQEYNGYVAVDKTMNKVVILPENKVTLQDTIAGVTLTKEQSHDLKEGKRVDLSNMSADGGRKFDGTIQINAATAGIEVKPAAHELQQRQGIQPEQTVKGTTKAVTVEAPKVETPKVEAPKVKRGPRL